MAWQAAEIMSLLRWQRHDILNHLQVISGYLQLQKSDRALDYLKEVVAWLEQVGGLMRLQQPELALAGLYKMEQAAARGITLTLDVHTLMEQTALDREATLNLWEAAWDLALDLAGEGGTLQVTLTDVEGGYHLQLQAGTAQGIPAAGTQDHLAGLAQRHGVPFTWDPAAGTVGLLFKNKE